MRIQKNCYVSFYWVSYKKMVNNSDPFKYKSKAFEEFVFMKKISDLSSKNTIYHIIAWLDYRHADWAFKRKTLHNIILWLMSA